MQWQKTPADLNRAFDAALPDDPRLERRTMFGFKAEEKPRKKAG